MIFTYKHSDLHPRAHMYWRQMIGAQEYSSSLRPSSWYDASQRIFLEMFSNIVTISPLAAICWNQQQLINLQDLMNFKIVPNTLHLQCRWCLLLLNVCGEFYNGSTRYMSGNKSQQLHLKSRMNGWVYQKRRIIWKLIFVSESK